MKKCSHCETKSLVNRKQWLGHGSIRRERACLWVELCPHLQWTWLSTYGMSVSVSSTIVKWGKKDKYKNYIFNRVPVHTVQVFQFTWVHPQQHIPSLLSSCPQPWINPLWLTRLKAPTNSLILSVCPILSGSISLLLAGNQMYLCTILLQLTFLIKICSLCTPPCDCCRQRVKH